MKTVIALFIFIISFQFSQAQEVTDTIKIKRESVFIYKDKIIPNNHLVYILKSNPEADREMTIATNNLTCSRVIAYTGGFIVGYSAVRFIMRGGGEYVRLGIAGALIASVSVPFTYAYNRHAKKAVLIYNHGLKNPPVSSLESGHACSIGFGPASNGIGITVSF